MEDIENFEQFYSFVSLERRIPHGQQARRWCNIWGI